MAKLIVMVGPCGSGKTTMAHEMLANMQHGLGWAYVNQDSQGKEDHLKVFNIALERSLSIVVDRMGFNKLQRDRYLKPAKEKGYETKIIVLHESYQTCLDRCLKRENHETIKDETNARQALGMFFSKYERVEDSEADEVTRVWPSGEKDRAIWSDLDGTLCHVEHRRHHVRKPEGQRKDWNSFFKEMANDTVVQPVMETLHRFADTHHIVYCSGRPDNYRKETEQWLKENEAPYSDSLKDHLFMRSRNDSRQDNITKQVILDFEVLTRYSIDFCLDDRDQVVKMLRDRGLTVFQVAEGDF
jgi:predicted kinase